MSALALLAREWALHVFDLTVQAILVAAALLAACAIARRSAPGFRSALLAVALAKFVIPPMLPFPTGIFSGFDAAPASFFERCGTAVCASIALLHLAGAAI